MKLYLVRHATANPEDKDPDKNLSEEGKIEASKVAEFLKGPGIEVTEIIHSKKPRAVQTADALAEVVKPTKMQSVDYVNPMDPIDELKYSLEGRDTDLMVVSHMPFLGKIASALITGDESLAIADFEAAAVLALSNENDYWQLQWMITPEILD